MLQNLRSSYVLVAPEKSQLLPPAGGLLEIKMSRKWALTFFNTTASHGGRFHCVSNFVHSQHAK